jgi:DNA-binding PadR family transcriptional regulator
MALSHAILTALLEEDLTGYQLAKKFDVSLGFFWRASHQQIYQELKRLHRDGEIQATEVEQSGKPNKKIYSLTDEGRQSLDRWVLAETRPRAGKDELFVKMYNVGHSSIVAITSTVRERREEHINRLSLYKKIEDRSYRDPFGLPDNKKGIYLALAAGIRQEETFIAWCDEALVLLATVKTPSS